MGVYVNSFLLLCDEDGEVDMLKLTKKAAEMEIKMKKRIQEIENQKNIINPLFIPSCHNDEVESDGWKVHESRRKRDGGGMRGGEAAVGSEKKQVKKKEGEGGESEEEREVYEGLVVEEITKGTQKVKRIIEKRMKKKAADIAIHSKMKKKANTSRKLNGKQSH